MAKNLREQVKQIVDAIAPAILNKDKSSGLVNDLEIKQSWQLLTDAAIQGEITFFQQLVTEENEHLATPSKAQEDFPMSMLMIAAFSGQTEVIQMLLAAGADPHYKSQQWFIEWDALSLAADKGHHEIVRLLVTAGADPNALNPLSRPLTTAVTKGRLETAQLLIELGADLNARGLLANNTLLIEAADKGQTSIVRLLLESGADLHVANNFHETALHRACFKGWVEITQLLVAAGADVNKPNKDRVPPLIIATASPENLRFMQKQGLLERDETLEDIDDRATQIVHILLEANADPNLKSGNGATALLVAVAQGLTAIVKALLAANADANLSNETNKTCNTPLITAIENGHEEIVQLLLDVGADFRKPSGLGIAPIDLANSKGLKNVVELLQQRGARVNAEATTITLSGAARSGDLETVQHAIVSGAVLDGDDREFPQGGLTALMYAAQAGYGEVLQVLIAAGADVNRHDARQLPWHRTGLMYAVEGNQLESVKLLLQAGADPNASDRLDKPGRTPLIYAAIEGHVEIVQALLNAGAIATTKDRKGNTALHVAYGNLAIVEMLLAAGADPYEPGEDDDSPIESASLMEHGEIVQRMLTIEPSDPEQAADAKLQALDWAVSHGDLASIKKLIEPGVNISIQSKSGSTPLTSAVIHGSFELVKYLVEAGADLTVTDEDGQNGLSLAIERGYLEIARWLLGVGATLPEQLDESELLIAASQHSKDAVQMLIDLGINVNSCDEDGETALLVATTNRQPEIVQFLIDVGADLEKYGVAVLEHALENGFQEIVDILENAGVHK